MLKTRPLSGNYFRRDTTKVLGIEDKILLHDQVKDVMFAPDQSKFIPTFLLQSVHSSFASCVQAIFQSKFVWLGHSASLKWTKWTIDSMTMRQGRSCCSLTIYPSKKKTQEVNWLRISTYCYSIILYIPKCLAPFACSHSLICRNSWKYFLTYQ